MTKSKTHPSARNRFILFNGELNKLPSSLFALLFNAPPVMKGVLTSIFKEPLVERNTTLKDESIHSFISRRLGVHVAENLVSAMVHGIYAGDIKKLSIKVLVDNSIYLRLIASLLSNQCGMQNKSMDH